MTERHPITLLALSCRKIGLLETRAVAPWKGVHRGCSLGGMEDTWKHTVEILTGVTQLCQTKKEKETLSLDESQQEGHSVEE